MVSNTPLIIYVLLVLKHQLFPPINWTITINDIIPMCLDHILAAQTSAGSQKK